MSGRPNPIAVEANRHGAFYREAFSEMPMRKRGLP